MRSTPVPASPSRSVLITGIAAPTAASKLSAPPCFSADFASRSPCLAISALLAVTTDLPEFSAASMAERAGSPDPPINSTRQSIRGSLASASGFFAQSMPRRSTPRFLVLERAVTATTRTPRPQRADNIRACSSMRRTTSAPTVPSPAIPTLRGATMTRKTCRREESGDLIRKPAGRSSESILSPGGERNHVVQRFNAAFKEAPHTPGRLADSLLVFHHGDANIALAMLAEGDPRRYHHARLFDHQGCELHAADAAERLRQRSPREHRRFRRRNSPARPPERFHQRVAALAVGIAHLPNAVLRAIERRGRRHLDWRESAVVEVGLHARQRRDDALVADRESHAPAGHRKRLRHRGELDRHVDGARNLEHRGRRVVIVEINFGVCEIRQDEDLVLFRERNEIAVKIECRDVGRRVGRVADHDGQRLGDGMDDRAFDRFEELRWWLRRYGANPPARH